MKCLFFRNKSQLAVLKELNKHSFVKIDYVPFNNGKIKKNIFGKCLSIHKADYNSTITVVHSVNKYKIIETFSLYNNFIKDIKIYKNS